MTKHSGSVLDRRSVLLLGSAAAMAGVLPAMPARAAAGGTLVMTINPEPNAMVSAFNTATPVAIISGKITEGLVSYDFDLNLQPELATAWEVAPDGLSVTFTLREGVRWHDGRPFTSADVAYSIMDILKEHNPIGREVFEKVTAVDTPDPLTAVIRLSEPAPALMYALPGWQTPIVPRHVYEGTDVLTNQASNAPIGTGPFRFVEWERGSHIVLEKNPDYWDAGKPLLDRLIVRIYTDPSARVAAFEAGELHLGGDGPIPLNEVKRFQDDPRFKVDQRGAEMNNSQDFLELNLRHEHLARPEVRKALMHAIDRDMMIQTVWYGLAEPLTGPIPPTMPHFYTADVPTYAYDPARAEALLDEAGLPKDSDGRRFALRMVWPSIGDTYDRLAQVLRQQFRAVGVDLDLRSVDVPTFTRQVYTDYDFDISLRPGSAKADPSVGVQRLYHSGAIHQGTPFVNASGYANPEVDAVLSQAAVEPDTARRAELFKRFQQLVMEDLPVLPLARPFYFTVASARVSDFVIGPDGVRSRYATLSID